MIITCIFDLDFMSGVIEVGCLGGRLRTLGENTTGQTHESFPQTHRQAVCCKHVYLFKATYNVSWLQRDAHHHHNAFSWQHAQRTPTQTQI